jgi:hypothetical protein
LQTVSEGGLNLPRPLTQLGEEGLGADCFAAKGDGDGTGNGDCAGGAAGVLMGNSTLVVCGLNQLLGAIVEEQANWAGSHGAAVAGFWGRGAGFLPGHPLCQSQCRLFCGPAAPDDAVFCENGCDAAGVVAGVKPATGEIAFQELSRQLGVVRVLAKGEREAVAVFWLLDFEFVVDVILAGVGGIAFYATAGSIAEALANQAAGELFLTR